MIMHIVAIIAIVFTHCYVSATLAVHGNTRASFIALVLTPMSVWAWCTISTYLRGER